MRWLALPLALVPAAAPAEAPLLPRFAEETATAGLATPYLGGWQYMVGGGVAVFDCSGDRRPEVFLAGGEGPAGLYLNESPRGGALAFRPAAGSGLEVDAVTGAYPADIDGDGLTDLLLLRVGENLMMRGEGDCRFRRANADWGFDGGDGWTTAAAITFEAGADWPTVATGDYIDRREELFPWGSCTPNLLHRPGPPGRFAAPEPLLPSFCALSMLFTDWDRSGRLSLRISNDREYYKGGQEQLWLIPPDAPPRAYGAAEGWQTLRIWGMGIAAADLTGDGYPDYYLTNMADHRLQVLTAVPPDGRPSYADAAHPRGLTAHRPFAGGDVLPSTGWHAEFADVNSDGLADLFVAKGNVAEMPDFARRDPNNLLVQGPDGRFVEAGERVLSFRLARGAAVADLNLDGLPDLVVQNRWEGPQVWRNTTAGAGNFLMLSVEGDWPNRPALGGILEVRTPRRHERREIAIGGGHGGDQLGWHHVGLGDAASAEVRLTLPGAAPGPWQTLPANGFFLLAPGRAPAPFDPG
jgi:hypothetical protein